MGASTQDDPCRSNIGGVDAYSHQRCCRSILLLFLQKWSRRSLLASHSIVERLKIILCFTINPYKCSMVTVLFAVKCFFCYANQSCCASFIRPDRFNTARTGSLGLDWSKKVARSRLPSVGFRSWSGFLAVNLQMMRVINPAVGCHYFPPGPQYQFRCLVNRGTMGVNSLPKTVTRQRRGYALNPDPSAP